MVTLALPFELEAADPPLRPVTQALTVERGACLEQQELARALVHWLRRDAIDARVSIVARQTTGGVAFVVRRDEGRTGERDLRVREAISCAQLHRALALAIAIAIDATVLDSIGSEEVAALEAFGDAPPVSETQPRAPERALVAPPRRPVPRPLPPPEKKVGAKLPRLAAALEGGLAVELVPELAFALGPSLELALHERAEIRAAALFSIPASTDVGAGRAEVQLSAGRLDGCGVLIPGSLRLRSCLGVAGGVASMSGEGFDVNLEAAQAWVAGVLRLDGAWFFSEMVGLRVAAEGFAPMRRPLLQVKQTDGRVLAERAWAPLALLVSTGLEVAFW